MVIIPKTTAICADCGQYIRRVITAILRGELDGQLPGEPTYKGRYNINFD
jgi:hypothetical protein